MPDSVMRAYELPEPVPRLGRGNRALMGAALLGAPLAWFLQLLVTYGLVSHACYPSRVPYPGPIAHWGWVWPVSLAVNLVALAIGCAAAGVAILLWRRARSTRNAVRLIEAEEGWTRFFAVWAIWSGAWFAIGVLFDTIALLQVPLCAG